MKIILIISTTLILMFRILELGYLLHSKKSEEKIKINFNVLFFFFIIWEIYLLTTSYYILGIFLIFKQSLFAVLEINMKSTYDKSNLKTIKNLLFIFDIIIPSVIISDVFNRILF